MNMKKNKLAGIALCALALATGLTQIAHASSFTDVSDTHWARPYIEELSSAGVLKGFPDGTFKPNDPVSLSETFSLIKGIKNPTEGELRQAVLSYGNMARRAGVEDWAYEAAAYALEQRVITEKQIMYAGKAGAFERPRKSYPTRREIASYYARALRVPRNGDLSILKLADLDSLGAIGDQFDQPVPVAEYVAALVKINVLAPEGSDGKFEGDRPIRRSEMARITKAANDYTPPARKERKVVIYTRDDCRYCNMAKVFLTDTLKTSYVEKNVETDEKALEEFQSKGYRSIPMIEVDDIVVEGFSPFKLMSIFEQE